MKQHIFWPAFIVVIGVLCAAAVARAQDGPQCAPIAKVAEWLRKEHGESPLAVGLMPNGMMQIYGNLETETWTLVRLSPDGEACLMAAGDNLQFATAVPPGDPA